VTTVPDHPSRLHRLVFGERGRIAGTVYGTIVVMATLTAGAGSAKDPWALAAVVATGVIVLWLAHVYAHALGESIESGHSVLAAGELAAVARREFAIPLAGVAPIAALLLGALGIMRESRAIWLAVLICLATLTVQGVRYAQVERLDRSGTIVAVTVNLALGLVIVALKAGVAH
jgi:hypothetical protein